MAGSLVTQCFELSDWNFHYGQLVVMAVSNQTTRGYILQCNINNQQNDCISAMVVEKKYDRAVRRLLDACMCSHC